MSAEPNPETGLPGFELAFLRLTFRASCLVVSDEAALRSFEQSSREILEVVDQQDLGVLSQQIRVPRLMGIESSSCNWSVLMVLEHLAIVNRAIMDIVRALRGGTQPFDRVVIANFKPDEDVGAEAIDRFREINQRYWSFAKSHMPLYSDATHRHPWFGELDGHQWHCLTGVHQKIHRRQIRKILALIGVA